MRKTKIVCVLGIISFVYLFRHRAFHGSYQEHIVYWHNRNFADFDVNRVIINEDICATAKSYEYMVLVSLNRNGCTL